jgi:uncharacterized membrane protein YfcA
MDPLLLLLIATFFSGFVDAIVGGGGLISVPTLLALGLPPTTAVASNKLIGVSTAIAGTAKYVRSGAVALKGWMPFLFLAFAFSLLGSYTTSQLSPEFLRGVIFIVCLGLFFYLLFKKQIVAPEGPPPVWALYAFPVCVALLGFYDGFFGPGTGMFLIMSIVYLQRKSLLQACANGRVINLTSNIAALVFFSSSGLIDFGFVWPAMITSFIGGFCGATYSVRYGSKGIRPIMFLVVFGLLCKLGWDLFA